MALRRFSLPIIFAALLLFSLVFARELEEKPAADKKKDVDLSVDDAKYVPDGFPYYRRPCRYRRCHFGCCSEAEYAAEQQMNEFNDDKQYGYGHGGGYGYGHGGGYGYGPRPGYGYGPGYGHGPYGHGPYGHGYGRGCYYRCGYRCCSAEEYAEFVQAENKDKSATSAKDFPPCPALCGRRCCSVEEFAAFSQGTVDQEDTNGLSNEKYEPDVLPGPRFP